MKRTWATINENLNRNRKSNNFLLEFIVNNESITDTKDIANHFNNFFSNIGTNLSSSIKLDDRNSAFTDYLHIQQITALLFLKLKNAKFCQL